MLKYLKLQNVGPAAEMELELGSRLNILTGDNGLGKSFLLDVAWFVTTGSWPEELNSKVAAGKIAIPKSAENHFITFLDDRKHGVSFPGDELHKKEGKDFYFAFNTREWRTRGDASFTKNSNSLVIYLMSDGSCAVFDPHKNETLAKDALKSRELPHAFVFDPTQIWDGLQSEDRKWLSNGLIRDWATWQNNGGNAFQFLKRVLEILSPSPKDLIFPGSLTRVSLDDVRDVPTIIMPYEGEVAVIHASSAIRRILSLAYVIVWAWEEHKKAANFKKTHTVRDVLIMIDEMDAHLHPSWQRKILPSILQIKEVLPEEVRIQLIATTHSPLIMASLEPLFDSKTDAWFDLDLVGENGYREVKLEKREFEILGNADDWLTSDAFDLESTGSLAAEALMKEVEEAMDSTSFDYGQAKLLHEKLVRVLPADDTFFVRWRMIGKQKGWWK